MNDLLDTAIENLHIIANTNHDHLLYERRHSEWHQRVLSSARASAAYALLTEIESVRAEASEQWTLPNS